MSSQANRQFPNFNSWNKVFKTKFWRRKKLPWDVISSYVSAYKNFHVWNYPQKIAGSAPFVQFCVNVSFPRCSRYSGPGKCRQPRQRAENLHIKNTQLIDLHLWKSGRDKQFLGTILDIKIKGLLFWHSHLCFSQFSLEYKLYFIKVTLVIRQILAQY